MSLINCIQVNSTFHPAGVDKLSTSLSGWG